MADIDPLLSDMIGEPITSAVTQDGKIVESVTYHSSVLDSFDYSLPSTEELLYKRIKLTPEEMKAKKQQHREATLAGDWTKADSLEKEMYGKVL
jgi:hypothetical protein